MVSIRGTNQAYDICVVTDGMNVHVQFLINILVLSTDRKASHKALKPYHALETSQGGGGHSALQRVGTSKSLDLFWTGKERALYQNVVTFINPFCTHHFFPRVILFLCLYREPQPKKPRRPHTTGLKPHQLKTPTPKTQYKTPTPKPQTPNHHK